VASVVLGCKFGALWPHQHFRGGYKPVARRLDDRERAAWAWLREQTARIPAAASVATTDAVGAWVSSRAAAWFYPEHTDADYLLLDEEELLGPEWTAHLARIASGRYELLARHERLALYRRSDAPR
jgi:hypothetical protein